MKTPSTGAKAFVLGVLRLAENLIRVGELPLKTENPRPSLTRAPLVSPVKAKAF